MTNNEINKNLKLNTSHNWLDFYTIRGLVLWILGTIIIISCPISNYFKDLIGMIILILLLTISIVGFIIAYIYPCYMYVPILQYLFKGNELKLIDLVFHQTPLAIHLLLLYNGYWKISYNVFYESIIFNLCWFIIYIMFHNPFEIYLRIS